MTTSRAPSERFEIVEIPEKLTVDRDGVARIGDLIYLSADPVGGYVFADGFDEDCLVARHRSKESIPLECLFEICVQHSYKAQRKLDTENKKKANLNAQRSFSFSQFKDPGNAQFEADAEEERLRNQYESARSSGAPVVYGQVLQLFHLKSSKHLSLHCAGAKMLDVHNISGLEQQSVQVLVAGSEDCWFRLEPRYRIKQFGDPVHFCDSVVLAAANGKCETPRMLCCCSEARGEISINGKRPVETFNICSSTDCFAWNLRPYRNSTAAIENPVARDQQDSQVSAKEYVKGGDVIRLMHKDIQAYLSFADPAVTTAEEAVQVIPGAPLRINGVANIIDTMPAFSLWRLELEDGTSGATAMLACRCRFLHIVTRKYLAYTSSIGGSKFSMVDDATDETLFQTLPVFTTEGPLKWQGCIHLRHKEVYVHAEESVATPSSRLLRQDAFVVEQVSWELVQEVLHALSASRALSSYLATVTAADGAVSLMSKMKYNQRFTLTVLDKLCAFCQAPQQIGAKTTAANQSDQVARRKRRQQLLRDLGILDKVFDLSQLLHDKILQANLSSTLRPDPTKGPVAVAGAAFGSTAAAKTLDASVVDSMNFESATTLKVFQLSHEVLQQGIKDIEANRQHLSTRTTDLLHQILAPQTSMPATDTVMEMFHSSEQILDKILPEQIHLLLSRVDLDPLGGAKYLKILSHVISCKGRGLKKNQEVVMQWLKERGSKKFLVATSLPVPPIVGPVEVFFPDAIVSNCNIQKPARKSKQGGLQIDIEELCKDDMYDVRLFSLYESMILFMVSLCMSAGTGAKEIFQTLISYETILHCMSNEKLPLKLRSYFTSLMHHLYIEQPAVHYLSVNQNTQLLGEIDNATAKLPAPLFEPAKEHAHFRNLKKTIIQIMTNFPYNEGTENLEDMYFVILATCRLCNQLLTLGFFSSEEDIQNILLPSIFGVLSFANAPANLSPIETTTRMNFQLEICAMLNFICELRLSVRIVRMLAIFKGSFMTNKSIRPGAEIQKLAEKMRLNNRDEIEKVLAYLAFPGSNVDGDVVSTILIDLMQRGVSELSVAALKLLIRDMSPRLELYKALTNTQILIDPAAISAFQQCQNYLAVIRRLLPALKSCMVNPSEKLLNSTDREQLASAIEQSATLCGFSHAVNANNADDLLHENYEIVRRSGIHTIILDIIQSAFVPYGDCEGSFILHEKNFINLQTPNDREMLEWLRKRVLKSCFFFIQQFCANSEINQSMMMPHVLLLMSCMDHRLNVTKALNAIFCNNETLCRNIDERVVIRLFDLLSGKIPGKRLRPRRKPHYLRFLQTICKANDAVISRNQVCIIKYLSDNGPLKLHIDGLRGTDQKREEVLVLFRGKDGEACRENLKSGKDNGLLEYYIALLQLLQTLLIDHLPEICTLIRVMLPPEKIRDDISKGCPAKAEGELLNLMRELYLSDYVARRHPLLAESLWDIMSYKAQRLKETPIDSYSRYSQEESDKEAQRLLLDYWAPLLQSIFAKEWIMRSISEQKKAIANEVIDRIIELLNNCALDQLHASKLYQIYLAAKHHSISGASILSDKAAAAAKLPASGAADVKGTGTGATGMNESREEEDKVRESVEVFAKVLLEVMDPPSHGGKTDLAPIPGTGQAEPELLGGGQQEENDASHVIRCELRNLSHVFVNSHPGRPLTAPSGGRPARRETMQEFKADLAAQLIDTVVKYEWRARGDWEADTVVCLRVLVVLVMKWRASATAVQPPPWLTDGVPQILMHFVRGEWASDTVVLCCLELGIASLHGGNRLMQSAFHRTFTARGCGDTLAELRRRIHTAEGEARARYHHFRQALEGRCRPDPLLPDRSLHALVVQSNGGRPPPAATHVDKLFRFLQLLCEGQNLTLQNYLRYQPESPAPVDLVSAVAGWVEAVTGYLNPWTAVGVTKAMYALAESVMNPCRPNQRLLVETKLCACGNEILDTKGEEEVPGLEGDYGHVINELKAATVIALLSLLECVDDKYIPDRMLASLNMSILVDNMNFLLRTYNPTLLLLLKARHDQGDARLQLPKHLDKHFWHVQPLARNDEMDLLLDESRRAQLRAEERRRNDAEEVALYLYIIFKTLSAYDGTGRLERLCGREYMWDVDKLRGKVGVIEISRKGVVEKAYFIVPDVCRFLTEASKDHVTHSLDRTNLQTQLTDFTGRFDTLYQEMRHQQRLSRHRLFRALHASSPWRERLFLYNAVVINVVLLVGFAYQCNGSFTCGDNEELTDYRLVPEAKNLCQALIAVQLVLAIIRQVWYVVERGILKARQRVIQGMRGSKRGALGGAGRGGGGRDWVVDVVGWCLGLSPSSTAITHRHHSKCRRIAAIRAAAAAAATTSNAAGAVGGGGGISAAAVRVWRVGWAVVTRIERLQVVCWLVAALDPVLVGHGIITLTALLALTLQTHLEAAPLLLLAHLFEVLNQSPVLRNVIRSITYRGNSLLQTGMLALILYYLFGVVGFVVSSRVAQGPQALMTRWDWGGTTGGQAIAPNNNNARCTSMWKCTLIVFDVGLRKLDIGYGMKNLEWNVESDVPDRYRILYRMIYTFVFYVMVTTILMNIIFGIIIDTFAELRENKDKVDESVVDVSKGRVQMEEEMRGRCFICGIHRFVFDAVYLREKEVCDYSGGEWYVFGKSLLRVIDDETHEALRHPETGLEIKVTNAKVDLLWFPQRVAMVLKTQRTWSEQALLHKVTTLDKRLQTLAADIKSACRQLNKPT